MRSTLSNEFLLTAACCGWPPSAERDRRVEEAASGPIDWAAFLRIVRRHRVEGLVYAALRHTRAPVPAEIRTELAATSAAIATENLLHAAASLRLQSAFAKAGVPILFVKGLTLSMLAYGTLSLKKARDIDLVVPADAVSRASGLLAELGYRCLTPSGAPVQGDVAAWAALSKETLWRADSGILAELHTSLVDNPIMLPGIGVNSPTQLVTISPGKSLPTLQKDELFSYLCVHGAAHAWSRIKWLADVAAFIAADDADEIERVYRRSIELGAGRSTAQGLLLCRELFGTSVSDRLVDELNSDSRTRWLVRIAFKVMSGANGERELDETVLGTVPIHISHFLLSRGGRYKLAELKRKSAGRPMPGTLAMPRGLRKLQPLLSIPLWLRARWRERIRK